MDCIVNAPTRESIRRREVWQAALRKAQAAFAELRYAEKAYVASTKTERNGQSVTSPLQKRY